MTVEAFIGMLLVRLGLVGDDASVSRAVVMPLHLVSTLLLLGAMTLTACFSLPPCTGCRRDVRGTTLVGVGLFGFHPLLALVLLGSLVVILPRVAERSSRAAERLTHVSLVLCLFQGVSGALNVLLRAPAGLQVVHLFASCSIWIALVSLGSELWSPRAPDQTILGAVADLREASKGRPLAREWFRGWPPMFKRPPSGGNGQRE